MKNEDYGGIYQKPQKVMGKFYPSGGVQTKTIKVDSYYQDGPGDSRDIMENNIKTNQSDTIERTTIEHIDRQNQTLQNNAFQSSTNDIAISTTIGEQTLSHDNNTNTKDKESMKIAVLSKNYSNG